MSREESLKEQRLEECKQKLIEASILFSKLETFIQENPNCKITINNDFGYKIFMKTIVDNNYDPNELLRNLHKEKTVSLKKHEKDNLVTEKKILDEKNTNRYVSYIGILENWKDSLKDVLNKKKNVISATNISHPHVLSLELQNCTNSIKCSNDLLHKEEYLKNSISNIYYKCNSCNYILCNMCYKYSVYKMITDMQWENDYYNYTTDIYNYQHLLTMAMNNNLLCKNLTEKLVYTPSLQQDKISIEKKGETIHLEKKYSSQYNYICDNCMHSYDTVGYTNGNIDICPYCVIGNRYKNIVLSFKSRRKSVRKSRKRSLRKSRKRSLRKSRKRSLRKSRKRSLRKSKRI